MKEIVTYMFSLLVVASLLSCQMEEKTSQISVEPTLLTSKTQFTAGSAIQLRFTASETISEEEYASNVYLIATNAFGPTKLYPQLKEEELIFHLPQSFYEKSGVIQWSLFNNKTEVETGILTIKPSTVNPSLVETYVGPTRLTAGTNDFAMTVIVPTDRYDNLLDNGAKGMLHRQFKNETSKTLFEVNNGIYFNTIPTTQHTGSIFIAATVDKTPSKETVLEVFSAPAKSFKIKTELTHPYADGNQTFTISTTQIVDTYNNPIADGTVINFSAKDDNSYFYEATGLARNGKAAIQFLHPSYPTTLTINAQVPSFGKTDVIEQEFKSAVTNVPVNIDKKACTITVGPVTGYLGQLIPDGSIITIQSKGVSQSGQSNRGKTTFHINDLKLKTKLTTTATVSVLGFSKTIQLNTCDEK